MTNETIEQTAEWLLSLATIQTSPHDGETPFNQIGFDHIVQAIRQHTEPKDARIAELEKELREAYQDIDTFEKLFCEADHPNCSRLRWLERNKKYAK